MHPRYIPTVEQFRATSARTTAFLLEHREPSRLGGSRLARRCAATGRPAAALAPAGRIRR